MRKRSELSTAFQATDSLNGCTAFFLVGIGGAGMSALARMFAHRDYSVAGTDSTVSPETERLIEEGHQVFIGHTSSPLTEFVAKHPDAALVVTDAIDLDNSPEYREGVALGIPIVRRSQALGWLLRNYKVLAVTGTHGKTTTTGMLGAGLIAAGLDPLVVVGAAVMDWNGPIREGKGEYAVVEACEAYEGYADIDPYIVLLTNLEPDHLDYHGTYENLRESMVQFVSKVPPEGGLVFCADDRGASEVAELTDVKCMPYGLSDAWLQQISNKFSMGIDAKNSPAGKALNMVLPGDHNRMNATGALAVASLMNSGHRVVDVEMVEMGVTRFGGAERRLQVLLDGSVTVVDDYAHHPSEISATIQALRQKYPGRRLVVVFQPHLYSRTSEHLAEFPKALDNADFVFVTDIYPARENPIPGVSSVRIADNLTVPMRYVSSRHLLPRIVRDSIQPGDVVCGMGAGNIHEFAPDLIRELERDLRPRKKVAVIYGGDSSEREVSILSGLEIAGALKSAGFDVERYDVTEMLLRKGVVTEFRGSVRPDVAFLAVHGTHAEDGAIQGFFELLGIPYTGSPLLSSALCMNKQRTKEILSAAGIRVPQGEYLATPSSELTLTAPVVIKPNSEGSTVGLTFAHTDEEIEEGLRKAFQYPGGVLVEEWIRGMEISVPVLNGKVLPVVEICPNEGEYDFANKYTVGATNEICPARLSTELTETAQSIALRCHEAMGCSGATRTDMLIRDGEIFVLEVNTLPGMTPTSLLPRSALSAGISFPDLCKAIAEEALVRHGN
ncbi:MAG TPA: UDP-N-acetylmuramate--L-alanine ligase, partial [Fimbriimonas sp.]|nr:UDP-N-acetylmuramate--L-alanine ligase [Fimbriimonas sp.]